MTAREDTMWGSDPAELDAEVLSTTRDSLHRVAVHVVARARVEATGRFGLRVTPGGFGTPELGDDLVRVRVTQGRLVRESGGVDGTTTAATPVHGSTLRELAALARVDLDAPLSVGHDTPPLGDPDAPLIVDAGVAAALCEWYRIVAAALDHVAAVVPSATAPSLVQLWPEHFDVAFDVAFDAREPAQRRVNLGGSPGDGHHLQPYAYIGPWTPDRPGDSGFWNASFGATLSRPRVMDTSDPVGALVEFYRSGLDLLAGDALDGWPNDR